MPDRDDHSQRALDSIDRFVAVGNRLARTPALRRPEYKDLFHDLYEVAQALLEANENMARWIHEFTYFQFGSGDATERFADLVKKYETAKKGGQLHEMKFHCGDIQTIYDNRLSSELSEALKDEDQALQQARTVFEELSNADNDMVRLIHKTVVKSINDFARGAQEDLELRSNLNAAERKRLQFRTDSAMLTTKLEELGGGLSDVKLESAKLAGIAVTVALRSGSRGRQ